MKKAKNKEKDSAYVIDSDRSDALILSLAGFSESWVIHSGASFHATSRHEIFQDYVKSELRKVYVILSEKAIWLLASQMARC